MLRPHKMYSIVTAGRRQFVVRAQLFEILLKIHLKWLVAYL